MEYSELLGKLASPLKMKTLALASLQGAYIFHDGNFWKVVEVDDVLTLQECQVQERNTLMRRNDPGDQLRAYDLLKSNFEEVFEVPV